MGVSADLRSACKFSPNGSFNSRKSRKLADCENNPAYAVIHHQCYMIGLVYDWGLDVHRFMYGKVIYTGSHLSIIVTFTYSVSPYFFKYITTNVKDKIMSKHKYICICLLLVR